MRYFAWRNLNDFNCLRHRMHCGSTPMRAKYYSLISIQALAAKAGSHCPDGHGWHVAKGQWWTVQQPAPSELLEFVPCGCYTGCKRVRYSCLRASLPCTGLCHCKPVKKDGHLRALSLVTVRSSTAILTTVIKLNWLKINLSDRRSLFRPTLPGFLFSFLPWLNLTQLCKIIFIIPSYACTASYTITWNWSCMLLVFACIFNTRTTLCMHHHSRSSIFQGNS